MTTTQLQKKAEQVEKYIKKGSRLLLELEVAQARWEREQGIGKVYTSAAMMVRDAKKSR
ncbi:MAG: hypothetical protein KGJ35_00805 [Patescibacteria group bacterium]|nr:hypothetical protein [Patescibacteria group bacterium]